MHLTSEAPLQEGVIPYPEFLLRILFSAFYPAVKLAVEANCPLDTVKDMMTLAMWREAKRKHSTINLISLIFGKSTRTVKSLSARFNKGGFFEENEINLMRRVEDLLRQRPMTADELARYLPHSNEFDSARLALGALQREGRIEEMPGPGRTRYRVVTTHQRLVSENWEQRLDALSEHLEAITETIRLCFLERGSGCAAARTFSFKARRSDMEALKKELFEFIRDRYQQLEERAQQSDAEDTGLYTVYAGMTPVPDSRLDP